MNPGESIEEEEIVDSKGNLCGIKFILWYHGSVKKEWYQWYRTPGGCTKSLQKLEEKK
jgi:hypothetical protein